MYFKTDAGSIYYEVNGPQNAPAVVFTHGGGLNGDMFKSQVQALQDSYRVVTWDLQGHGRSAPMQENLDIPMMADCLVGQSLGVYVSRHAALKYPHRVKAHVSIGGLPVDEPMSKVMLYGFRILMSISRLFPASAAIFVPPATRKGWWSLANGSFCILLPQTAASCAFIGKALIFLTSCVSPG